MVVSCCLRPNWSYYPFMWHSDYKLVTKLPSIHFAMTNNWMANVTAWIPELKPLIFSYRWKFTLRVIKTKYIFGVQLRFTQSLSLSYWCWFKQQIDEILILLMLRTFQFWTRKVHFKVALLEPNSQVRIRD